jgi:hypothetical protein
VVSLLLITAVLTVYWPVAGFSFINFDDLTYVGLNPHVNRGLSWRAVGWAFSTSYSANWHPLSWLSHMLDVELFGLRPGPHHTTSLLIHCVNTVLLFLLLSRTTRALWQSAVVAALFGLHPLSVESVAWVAERKNLLCAFFWILTMRAHVHYAERPSPGRYAVMVGLFCCGLMAKPMIVTLPFVLLLLDYWPLRRTAIDAVPTAPVPAGGPRGWAFLVREKIPLFALSLAVCVASLITQRLGGGMPPAGRYPLAVRLCNSLVSYARYLTKFTFPTDLAIFYPYPQSVPLHHVVPAALLLVGASWLCIRAVRPAPWLCVGWLWYLGVLIPVIGIVQVGDQAMADRYMYVPIVGILISLAWGAAALVRTIPYRRTVLALLAAVAIGECMIASRLYLMTWRDTVSVFTRVVRLYPGLAEAHHKLATEYLAAGLPRRAFAHLSTAHALSPERADVINDMGVALELQGDTAAAIVNYREALRLKPDLGVAKANLERTRHAAGPPHEPTPRERQ